MKSWFTGAIGACAVFVLIGGIFGFAVLPGLEGGTDSLWLRICRAAGVSTVASDSAPIQAAAFVTTGETRLAAVPAGRLADFVGRGATLALRCAMCHGARGFSNAETPNLAGQYPDFIYKQLRDYASGARANAIMSPRVANLTDADLRDLASYYAYLPRLPAEHPDADFPKPFIVASGAPMRNIPPCGACHAAPGSAWLEGQSVAYLRRQLQAFASGARHNDPSQRMRNVARGMSPTEIESASRYYARQE